MGESPQPVDDTLEPHVFPRRASAVGEILSLGLLWYLCPPPPPPPPALSLHSKALLIELSSSATSCFLTS